MTKNWTEKLFQKYLNQTSQNHQSLIPGFCPMLFLYLRRILIHDQNLESFGYE